METEQGDIEIEEDEEYNKKLAILLPKNTMWDLPAKHKLDDEEVTKGVMD